MTMQTNQPLFRREVLQQNSRSWLGSIVLVRPLSFAFMAAGGMLCAAVAASFLFFGEYTKKVKATGYLVPVGGLIKVAAQQSGLVTALSVVEGQFVLQNQVIATLSFERLASTGNAQLELGRQLSEKRRLFLQEREKTDALYEQQLSAARTRGLSLRAELEVIERNLTLQNERLENANSVLSVYKKMQADGFISELATQPKKQDRLAELASLENMRRTQASILRELRSAENELASIPLKKLNEISSIDRSIASIDQDKIETETRREVHLVAPQSGTVTAIATNVGKLVPAGQTVFSIIPAGSKLIGELYLPARSAGFAKNGAKTSIQFQAFPYQKFGSQDATILQFSRTAVTAGELTYPAPKDELFYVATAELSKQTVTVYGEERRLQSGMQIDASIYLDRRTLIEWMFEPLFSISGKWFAGGTVKQSLNDNK